MVTIPFPLRISDFLFQARSALELRTQLLIAEELQYVSTTEGNGYP